jgi:hypothetical protein
MDFQASRGEVVRSATQRPMRKRMKRPLATRRGSTEMMIAAARPAAATTPMPARTPTELSEVAAADDASGVNAAVSIRPSMKRERQTVPTHESLAPKRRTTATRTTSSKRPGSAAPPTAAAPPAAARAILCGRCAGAKRRCQPKALNAYERRKKPPAAPTSLKFALARGQPVSAKCRAARTATPMPSAADATLSAILPFLDRQWAMSRCMLFTIVVLPTGLNPQKGTNG